MSALAARRPNDAYYTPDALAVACVSALALPAPKLVVEPSVGGGAFARAVRARWPSAELIGVDIDPDAPGFAHCTLPCVSSWPDSVPEGDCVADLVVGNPPYSEAEEHVRIALTAAPVVGMLLRLGFLAGQKRRAFWDANPPAEVHVLSRRPSFTGGGTDSTEYAFFVWDRNRTVVTPRDGYVPAVPVLRWLDWGGAS